MTTKGFIIIGGGIAGLSAIKAIREENKTDSILWISEEDRMPYKRTQINKNIVAGFEKNDFALVNHDWLIDNHIELLFDKVDKIDTEKHELAFKHRGHMKYRKLLIATGNIPKQLEIDDFPKEKIFHINTARQVENIIRSTLTTKKYLVIGAGIEGIETADQLIKLGKEVTIVDRNPLVIKRYFTAKFSHMLGSSIQKAGAKLFLNVKELKFINGDFGHHIIQIDENNIEFDAIISTIGYTPNIKLANDSNIKCNIGILVNENLQTSHPDVFAAGDVAEHPSGIITGLWHAAEEQGRLAGLNITNKKTKVEIRPFRMKTEVFGEFYFSVPPKAGNFNLISEERDGIVRDMYFRDNKLHALLMKNDKDRAKIYQQALMEKWDLEQIHKLLPLK